MSHATDPTYLKYQYADSEKLRIRQEAHRLYSENSMDFYEWVVDLLAPEAGERVADVGCGPGSYHPYLARRGVTTVALDASFGMVQDVAKQAQARQGSAPLSVLPVQASAEQLPLADGSADRLMANHMLYHVPEQEKALAEMRRVVKSGGRVVLATNSADQYARLLDLHADVARSLGFTPLSNGHLSARFTLDHLSLVRRFFPDARVEIERDAFLFPSTETVLRYYATAYVDAVAEATPAGDHRQPLLQAMAARIDPIIAREGVYRVGKSAGCFVAERT